MVVCRTPRCSPESNGLAEAFFGSFKRDYVYQGELESLEAVAQKLPEWIKDYNEIAPHSALGDEIPGRILCGLDVKNKPHTCADLGGAEHQGWNSSFRNISIKTSSWRIGVLKV